MTDLAYVLRHLPSRVDPNLLAGEDPADDAAVYRIRDDLALVQTVDFFTPVVDDPFSFGQIAAANSLSDVYAMGGSPLTALNIVAFPSKTLSLSILSEILRGGAEKAAEAGVSVVGGHTVDDDEPKYGMAVTGVVHPNRFVRPEGGRIGDRVFLTKPIGTGLVSTALKRKAARNADVEQAIRWMTTLNRSACKAMLEAEATAATDITGFGLVGHLADLCRASGVSSRLHAGAIPLLPGALDYAREGTIPAGTWTNLEYVAETVRFANEEDSILQSLLLDPQTSGGLLVCVPPNRCNTFRECAGQDMLTADIGELIDGPPGTVFVEA